MKMKSPATGNILMLLLTIWYLIGRWVSGLILQGTLERAIFTMVVGLFVPFLLYLLFTKQKPTDVLQLNIPNRKNVILAIILGIALVPVVITITMIVPILRSFIFPPTETLTSFFGAMPSIWALIVVGAIFPGVFEEIWFRGAIYNQYHGHKNGVSIAKTAIITGLIFGLLHGNILQIIYAFPFGIMLAYLLYYTRSIWIPILTHFIINALSMTLGYISQRAPGLTENYLEYAHAGASIVEGIILFGGLSLIMMPVVIICLKKFKKHHITNASHNTKLDEVVEEESKIFTWPFWATIVILVVYTLLRDFGIIDVI